MSNFLVCVLGTTLESIANTFTMILRVIAITDDS